MGLNIKVSYFSKISAIMLALVAVSFFLCVTPVHATSTNMWTANYGSSSVTKIAPNGATTTYTGIGGVPISIAFDGTNMWTANYGGNSVTKIAPNGATTTYTGIGGSPRGIAFDGTNMWTANENGNSVTKIAPNGATTTYTGTGNLPYGIAFDGTNMWTANYSGNSVTKIAPDGTMTTYTGIGTNPIGIAFDGTNMWTANENGNSVTKIAPNGATTTYTGIGGVPISIAFDGWTLPHSFNSPPSTPTSLGPVSLTNGSYTTSTQPTFTFTQNDPDASDTVAYTIQIATSSTYSNPVVNYTSALMATGTASFAVGQSTGSGTYTAGTQGQTLSDNSYYWRVMSIDNNGATSSWADASTGVAFIVNTTSTSSSSSSTSSTSGNTATTSSSVYHSGPPSVSPSQYEMAETGTTQLLSEINQLTAQINQLKAELQTAESSSAGSSVVPADCTFDKYLQLGDTGKEVSCLQDFLKSQGADIYPQGLVTGYFGQLTKQAVINFQNEYSGDILAPWNLSSGNGNVYHTTLAKIKELLDL